MIATLARLWSTNSFRTAIYGWCIGVGFIHALVAAAAGSVGWFVFYALVLALMVAMIRYCVQEEQLLRDLLDGTLDEMGGRE